MTLSLAASLSEQRHAFEQAERAYQKGQVALGDRLSKQLTQYPLYPYLRYERLKRRLPHTSPETVAQFLTEYTDTPMAEWLRTRWLFQLARTERWDDFLAFYQPSTEVELQCYHRRALLAKNQTVAAFADLATLWNRGHSLPKTCDPVFQQWINAQGLPPELVWARVKQVMAGSKDSALLNYLNDFLSLEQQQALELWRRLIIDPRALQQTISFPQDNAFVNTVLMQTLAQLARLDPHLAIAEWQRLKTSGHQFSAAEQVELATLIAIRLAWQHDPDAQSWLAAALRLSRDPLLYQWQIRVALWYHDWETVIVVYSTMPPMLAQHPIWRYWYARALEASAGLSAALPLYYGLRTEAGYYGIQTRLRLNSSPLIPHQSPPYDPELVAVLEHSPGIQRALEFKALKRPAAARREWNQAMSTWSDPQLIAAAALATREQWPDRAIAALGRASPHQDSQTLYPLAFLSEVQSAAHNQGLDPAWLLGVIRQESAFMADVGSGAGALGLMQLMPATANALHTPPGSLSTYDILKPAQNIALGSLYLKKLMDRYDDQAVLAIAAYNAGPSRVDRWLPPRLWMTPDVWIDNIPFLETRQYVKNVMAHTLYYQARLEQPLTFVSNFTDPLRR